MKGYISKLFASLEYEAAAYLLRPNSTGADEAAAYLLRPNSTGADDYVYVFCVPN